MEIRSFALHILESPELERKLEPADGLTDLEPGPALRIECPARSKGLEFAPRRQRGKMPSPVAMCDPALRAVGLHYFANHELMAVELMAFGLLAWPEMPSRFRQGLVSALADEQKHFRLYQKRMRELAGLEFGALPVNDHFWRTAPALLSPLHFVATLGLTFENGNLDHALRYARIFERLGDLETRRILLEIYNDEIHHVRFGLHWLRLLKPAGLSDWDAYCGALTFPTHPGRARGPEFDFSGRRLAGLDEDFIQKLHDFTFEPLARQRSDGAGAGT